ncbi:MAG: YicC/YloC family endoribonuclease [Gemmatimonadaceae bacterium]
MTGFGAVDGTVGAARVSVELRSVNHRFFNATIRLPAELSRWESEVREALRKRIVRGHISLTARVERSMDVGLSIDEARFATAAATLRQLRDKYKLEGSVDVAAVLRMPDVIASASEAGEGDSVQLVELVDRAVDALTKAREDEGTRLAGYLHERISLIDAALVRIAARAPERIVEQRNRLRENVRQLLDGIPVDEQRVAMEIAVMADRLDVQEELARFRSHIAAFGEALSKGSADGVGKRLGFLLQEMLREANTTGSKANDSAILSDVVTVKEELERIREQVENLE